MKNEKTAEEILNKYPPEVTERVMDLIEFIKNNKELVQKFIDSIE